MDVCEVLNLVLKIFASFSSLTTLEALLSFLLRLVDVTDSQGFFPKILQCKTQSIFPEIQILDLTAPMHSSCWCFEPSQPQRIISQLSTLIVIFLTQSPTRKKLRWWPKLLCFNPLPSAPKNLYCHLWFIIRKVSKTGSANHKHSLWDVVPHENVCSQPQAGGCVRSQKQMGST